MLNHSQREALVIIARTSIAAAVSGKRPPAPQPTDEALVRQAGAFVTIRLAGELRGCIGLIEPNYPLWETVRRAAVSAATEDFRFQPLHPNELSQIRLEISVLSALEEVKDISTIQVGTHGLVAEQGMRRGLLLPQVPREQGWGLDEFISHTCQKAGLSPNAWQQGAKLFRFTALIFGEEQIDPNELYLHLSHEEAFSLLKQHLKSPNLLKHSLATEAVLAEIALHLGDDVPNWRLCGLLHDIDYDLTTDNPDRHTLLAEEILLREGINETLIHAVKAHNDQTPRETLLDKALWATDPLTGLIVAAALISPEKRLAAIDTDFVLNRMKEKSFARGANREQINACADIGLDLEAFIGMGLKGMQQIASDLGL